MAFEGWYRENDVGNYDKFIHFRTSGPKRQPSPIGDHRTHDLYGWEKGYGEDDAELMFSGTEAQCETIMVLMVAHKKPWEGKV